MDKGSLKEMNNPESLSKWLQYIETKHPEEIELGLDRILEVGQTLGTHFKSQLSNPTAKIITVAGTNGKGSTVSLLEKFALANQLRVFSYTSPHVINFNERIRINAQPVVDDLLIEQFSMIEKSRKDTALTFFEFTTLAALNIAFNDEFDVIILEVGLGGRLDAVNIVEPDISIVTSLGIDHVDWLGSDIEAIAREKFGIARSTRPLILGDEFSESINQLALNSSEQCFMLNRDFFLSKAEQGWSFKSSNTQENSLETAYSSHPSIHPKNMAAALKACSLLHWTIPVQIKENFYEDLFLPGRFERCKRENKIIFDVSHNYQAIKQLASKLEFLEQPVLLICGMLKDKQIELSLAQLCRNNYRWYLCDTASARGAKALQIQKLLPETEQTELFEHCGEALNHALKHRNNWGAIVVFGSFLTVEAGKMFVDSRVKC